MVGELLERVSLGILSLSRNSSWIEAEGPRSEMVLRRSLQSAKIHQILLYVAQVKKGVKRLGVVVERAGLLLNLLRMFLTNLGTFSPLSNRYYI